MIQQPFGIPIYVSDDTHPIEPEFIEYMEKLPKRPNDSANQTSKGSYILEMPKFAQLKIFLQKEINRFFHTVLQVDDAIEIYITQSWLNFNRRYSSHHRHHHPNSVISGSFYFQGENVPIMFHRESSIFEHKMWDFPYKQINDNNCSDLKINNEIGKVVMFPSQLEHEVVVNPNPENRISLAFNTFVKGKLGQKESLTELKLE